MAEPDQLGPQMPLALPASPDQRFDRFVAPPSGLLAHLQRMADGQPCAPTLLEGAGGTGKTHLLLATCARAQEAGRRARYLPLAGLRGRLGEALAGLPDGDLVAIDGLDAIAGDDADELAVFDLHNRMHDLGRPVLYALSGALDGLPLRLADLRSRLAQCARWRLAPLDDAARGELLSVRAAARGLDVDAAAVDWLLRRCDRDPASLGRLLERLDHASLAAQRRLTVPFLRLVLGPADREE